MAKTTVLPPAPTDGDDDAPESPPAGLGPAIVIPAGEIDGGGEQGQAPAAAEPARRGRGRPRKDGGAPGSPKPTKTKAKKATDVEALSKQVQGIHLMLSMMTPFPELAISDMEAGMIAKGLVAVADEYGLALDGKTGAAVQMFAAAAFVYGPRALKIRARLDAQQKAADQMGGGDGFNSAAH